MGEEEIDDLDESDAARWAAPSTRTVAAVGAALTAAAAASPVFKVWIEDMKLLPSHIQIPAGKGTHYAHPFPFRKLNAPPYKIKSSSSSSSLSQLASFISSLATGCSGASL